MASPFPGMDTISGARGEAIDVPLLPDDGSVRINLQDVFERTYNYQQPPPLPAVPGQRLAHLRAKRGNRAS